MTKVSPMAPAGFPALPEIRGVRFAVTAAGIRYRDRTDLLLGAFDAGTAVAGTLTRSKTSSAPVDWCRRHLGGGVARALVVNSGNANAFTGRVGQSSVEKTAAAASSLLGCDGGEVFLASTGVIGERLPDETLVAALSGMPETLSGTAWEPAARAIMTTDTYPKGATATAKIGDTTVTINGIAKGSGMIAPDMATMLAFVATDAAVPAPVLQRLLSGAIEKSFNAITVDSDTSTSDTVLLFATGAAGNTPPADAGDGALGDFAGALDRVLLDLAHQVVRDGEGASKFIAVTVTGAESDQAAKRIGLSIANSPLVKTAIAGEDANWGRIVMAVGKAGEAADRDRLSISVGGIEIAAEGEAVAGYDETPVTAHMKGRDIDISVDVGIGSGRATVWTCDLTHDYIDINADYRS